MPSDISAILPAKNAKAKKTKTKTIDRFLGGYSPGGSFEDDTALIVCHLGGKGAANKRFVETDGKITKIAAANVSGYAAMCVSVPSVEAMADLLRIVGEDESACLVVGRVAGAPGSGAKSDPFRLVSAAKSKELGGDPSGWHEDRADYDVLGVFIARNKENLRPSSWLLLDRDFTDDQPEHLKIEDITEWRAKMIEVYPALGVCPWVDLPSSSTRLIDAKGKTVFPSPSTHHFVQMTDANDLGRLGAAMLAKAVLSDIGFRRTWGEKSTRSWTIYDPSTFSWERLSFDGKPVTDVEGTSIAPPDVSLWYPPEGGDGTFDTATIRTPIGADATKLRTQHGLTITQRSTKGKGKITSLRADVMNDDSSLTLESVVTVRLADGDEETDTIAKLWLQLLDEPDQKVRAQAPFRESGSWAALVRLDGAGLPFVYDVGPGVLYRLVNEDRAGIPLSGFMDLVREAKRELEAAESSLKDGVKGAAAEIEDWRAWGLITLTAAARSLGRWVARKEDCGGELIELVEISEGIIKGGVGDRRKRIEQWADFAKGVVVVDDDVFASGDMPEIGEALADMNTKHGVAIFGAKTALVSEEKDGLERWVPRFLAPGEMQSFMQNKKAIVRYAGGISRVPIFPVWMEWAERNTFSKVTFRPEVSYRADERTIKQGGAYNAWQGYQYEPIDPADDTRAQAALDTVLEHIRDVICDGATDKEEWLLNWLACAVQEPERVNLPVPVFKSEEGAGKGILVDNVIMPLFGVHGIIIDKPEHLTGKFNAHLGWSVMISVNEAIWGGDKQRAGAYKAMITDEYRALEPKFRDAIMVKNFSKLIISTNEDWFAPIGNMDRRHAVFDVSDHRRGDTEYFIDLAEALPLGRQALLHVLLARKVDSDLMRQAPGWASEAATVATMRSADSVTSFMYEWLGSGSVQCPSDIRTEHEGVETTKPTDMDAAAQPQKSEYYSDRRVSLDLSETGSTDFLKVMVFHAYVEHCRMHKRFEEPTVNVHFWRQVRKMIGKHMQETRPKLGALGRARVVTFGPVPKLRKAFGKNFTKPVVWDDVDDGE